MNKSELILEKLQYDWSQDNFEHIRLTLIEDVDQFISIDISGIAYNGIFSIREMDVFLNNGDDGWIQIKDTSLVKYFTQLCNAEMLIINALAKERGIYVDEVKF